MKMIPKTELIERLGRRFPTLTHADIKACTETLLRAISEALARGERAEFRGFGTFHVTYRRPRRARNPKTGERLLVPAKGVPHFKAGKELREAVDR